MIYVELNSLFSRSYSSYSKVRSGLIRITFWSPIWDQCTVHMYISMWVKLQASKCFQNRASLGSEFWSQNFFSDIQLDFRNDLLGSKPGRQLELTHGYPDESSVHFLLPKVPWRPCNSSAILQSAHVWRRENQLLSTWTIMALSHELIPISALRIMCHFSSLFDNLLQSPCKHLFSALNDLAYSLLKFHQAKWTDNR
jgi:hypothetical protein